MMGEYIKYRGETIKIGTCENLYYATYPKYIAALKGGLLSKQDNNLHPEEYCKPDSGFRFRFPFPDEDRLTLGSIDYNYSRGVSIKLDVPLFEPPKHHDPKEKTFQMEITQQKLVFREPDKQLCLALVWRDPKTIQSFRIEEEADVKKILSQIIKHHIQHENNQEQKSFYRSIAARILKGYRHAANKKLSIKSRNHAREIPPGHLVARKKR